MRYFYIIYVFVLAIFLPENAQANAGIPLIMYGEPLMILVFIPVLIIETVVYKIRLNKNVKDSFLVSLWANAYTTILGYPTSWILLLAYQIIASIIVAGIAQIIPLPETHFLEVLSIVFFMPAWLPPIYNIPVDLILCMLIIAGLAPAYYVSVRGEHAIIKKMWGDSKENKEACILANRITYSLILLGVIILFFYIYFNKS